MGNSSIVGLQRTVSHQLARLQFVFKSIDYTLGSLALHPIFQSHVYLKCSLSYKKSVYCLILEIIPVVLCFIGRFWENFYFQNQIQTFSSWKIPLSFPSYFYDAVIWCSIYETLRTHSFFFLLIHCLFWCVLGVFCFSLFSFCLFLHLIPVLPNWRDILLQLLSRVLDFLLGPVYFPLSSLSRASYDDKLCDLTHKIIKRNSPKDLSLEFWVSNTLGWAMYTQSFDSDIFEIIYANEWFLKFSIFQDQVLSTTLSWSSIQGSFVYFVCLKENSLILSNFQIEYNYCLLGKVWNKFCN